MKKQKSQTPLTVSESSGATRYFEYSFTDESVKKLIKYLKGGWHLKMAMSQCNISFNNKSIVIKKLNELGIKDYNK